MKVRNTTAFLASLQSILNKKLPHESEAKAKGRWKWMSKSPHCSQRKKSARVNCVDLQEADHGHSARRSLTLQGPAGRFWRANRGCHKEEILASEIFPINDREVFEVLEFTGTDIKNERNGESGRH